LIDDRRRGVDRQRSRSRLVRWVLGGIVVCGSVISAAVAVRTSRNGDARSVVVGGEWKGFEAVPLTPRAYPLVVWTGREAVIFGGTAVPARDNVTRELNDGAIYDPAKEVWRHMPDAPFEPHLASPTGLWTGSELIVVGAPCRDQTAGDSSQENCVPGGLKAGAFDPTRNSWRNVELPSVGANAHQHGIEAIGSNSKGSLWVLNGRYWFRTTNGTWDTLPAAPFRTRSLCLVDDQVVAVDYTDDGTYQQHLNDIEEAQGEIHLTNPTKPHQTASMVAAVFDLPDGHWKTIRNTHVRTRAARYLNSTCAPDGAYVYSGNIDEPVQIGFARYQARTESWETITAPPASPGVHPPAAVVDGRLVVWASALLQYEPTAKRWTSSPIDRHPTTVVPAGDRAILYSFLNGDDGTVQYSLFKPRP
jgi:hypothetical protein